MDSTFSPSRASIPNEASSIANRTLSFSRAHQRQAVLRGKTVIDDRPLDVKVKPGTIAYLRAARDACNWAKSVLRYGSGNQGHDLVASEGQAFSAMTTVARECNLLSNSEFLGEPEDWDNFSNQCEIIAEHGGGACSEAAYLTALYLAKEVDRGHLPSDTRIMGVKVAGMDHVQTLVGPAASFNSRGIGDLVIADAWVRDPIPVLAPFSNKRSGFQIHDKLDFESGIDLGTNLSFRAFEHAVPKGKAQKSFDDVSRIAAKNVHDASATRWNTGYLKAFVANLYGGGNHAVGSKTRPITYLDPLNRQFLRLDDLDSNRFFNDRQNTLLWSNGTGIDFGKLTSPFDFLGALDRLASGDGQMLLDHLANFPSTPCAVDLVRELLALGLADAPARQRACTSLLKAAAARASDPFAQDLFEHLVTHTLRSQKEGDSFVSKAVCELVMQGDAAVFQVLNDQREWPALIESVARRRGDEMEPDASALAAVGASVAGSPTNSRVLFEFCESDSLQGMAQMLRFGASPDAETRHGTLLLTDAMDRGRDSIAALLVEHGANIDVENESRQEPCTHAAIANMPELMNALLARNVDVEAVDVDGYSALGHAIANGHGEVAMQLVRAKALLNDEFVEALGKLPISENDRDDIDIAYMEQRLEALHAETGIL